METEVLTENEKLPYPLGSPRDVLTALFRQKNKIFVTFIVLFIGAGSWIYTQDTLYGASTTLVLKFGREQIFRPEVGDKDQIVRDQEGAVESEIKIIKSRDLVRRVVRDMGVENLYPDMLGPSGKVQERHIEKATSKFLGNLEALDDKGTNLLEIIFLHEQPEVAAKGANNLVEFLKERHLQIFSDPKSSFLIGRLKDYEMGLKNAEESLQEFKQKHDLSSPLVDQQARLLDQRVTLDTNHKTIQHELQALASKVISLESQMKVIPKNIPLSTTEGSGMGILSKAKSDLFALKRKEQELLTRYTTASAPVQNLQKEIELVEQFIAQTNGEQDKSVTSGKNPIYQKLEIGRYTAMSDLKTRRASHDVITAQIAELDQKLSRLDQLNKELVGLERKRVTAEENYKLYVKKVEEAKVSEEMDQLKMSNIAVIQAAGVPPLPAGRPKSTLLLLSAIISAIMSVGLALVVEFFTGGYTRPDQAAGDLGLPVLASFSQKI